MIDLSFVLPGLYLNVLKTEGQRFWDNFGTKDSRRASFQRERLNDVLMFVFNFLFHLVLYILRETNIDQRNSSK